MKQPDSTYRVQLSPQFNFSDLEKILDYLEDLGISTIYAAPFFQAREGSTHGYDVLDPFTINKEIGDLNQFRVISKKLQQKGITWLQDIVPNHMAFDSANPWIKNIFELGPNSRFYNFFDIDWNYKNWKKVITPFLGGDLNEVLEKGELKLHLDAGGFSFKYYENYYPVSAVSYGRLLSEVTGAEKFLNYFNTSEIKEDQWENSKNKFLQEVKSNRGIKENINSTLDKYNSSEKKLKEILELQYFSPTHWKQTEKEINYRRFFTINGLICLSMEDQVVFDTYHDFIKELCDEGLVTGLRIDHIDGLFDPEEYIIRLRELFGPDFYIIVEKILESDEKLPEHWPVQGTSGYDFLAQVNHLFTQSENEEAFNAAYEKISPKVANYEKLVYKKKLFILNERMGGELQNLWNYLTLHHLLPGDNEHEEKWKEALSAFLAGFPVYRIYPKEFPLKSRQLEIIETAYKIALEECPGRVKELDYLKKLLAGEANKDEEKTLYFLQRCQQFSGPLAAKGVEDTSFYIYNRLVAHNEVGDSPDHFGIPISAFHQKMLKAFKTFPLAINATATHDTKRGEDARMRLNVLSELAEEWFSKVQEWQSINNKVRENPKVPGKNEEYFIYQTLIGGLPFQKEEDFLSRTCDYLQKVLREAKVHSNWAEPDLEYEKTVFEFVEEVLNHEEFRASFDPFQKKIAGYGAIKSLGQNLIKMTAPGIPDTYQGTELWDLSYVDPDNRRPVDYALRMNYIADFRSFNKTNLNKKINSLKNNYGTGKIKMFALHKTLLQRRKFQNLYKKGEYIPLKLSGSSSEKFIAYARSLGRQWRIIVVPVLVTELFNPENLVPVKDRIQDLSIQLPENAPTDWDSVLTGELIMISNREMKLSGLISDFPVVLLKNRKQVWS